MPSIPLRPREPPNSGGNTYFPGGAGTMCRQGSHKRLSAEEVAAAEESFESFIQPVELYNMIRHRACDNPPYLQRCMRYKLEEKQKRRIHLTVSLYGHLYLGLQSERLFPMYVMLAKTTTNCSINEGHAHCHFKRCFTLSTCASDGNEDKSSFTSRFVLSERKKLFEEMKNDSLAVLFITCVEAYGGGPLDFSSGQSGHCLLGKFSIDRLNISSEWHPNSKDRSEVLSTVTLYPSVFETSCVDRKMHFSFQELPTPPTQDPKPQLDVKFVAENLGAKDFDLFPYSTVASSSVQHLMRLKHGDVLFNFVYYKNKLHRTQVCSDFSCAICLVKCASFKGLECHLTSSHDLFKFEFRVSEGIQAVDVYVKGLEICKDGLNIMKQQLSFCSKRRRRRYPKPNVPNGNHVHPHVLAADAIVLESNIPMETNETRDGMGITNFALAESVPSGLPGKICTREPRVRFQLANTENIVTLPRPSVTTLTSNHINEFVNGGMSERNIIRSSEVIAPSADIENAISMQGNSTLTAVTPQRVVTKRRSISHDTRIKMLQRRPVYNSQQAQQIERSDLLTGWDSEAEVDHYIADLQDRQMLDQFIDVTKDEKEMMFLWNSFLRRQRVLADGHIPWACENFSRMHAEYFVHTPDLLLCWRIFMIKLWRHELINERIVNNCNLIFQQLKTQQNNNNNNNNTPLLIKDHADNAAE